MTCGKTEIHETEGTRGSSAGASDIFCLTDNNARLEALRDRHIGQRCFIAGNGPSLRISDLDMLKDEITIASNKIFLAFDQTDWRPTYFTICDVVVARNNKDKIEGLDLVKVGAFSVKEILRDDPRAIFLNPPRREDNDVPFTWDLVRGARAGHSVVNLGIKLAYWMGIREIYVIGVDFNFQLPSKRTGEIVHGNEVLVSEGEINHFHPDYRKPGEEWTVPLLDRQSEEFLAARNYIESNGGKIVNASRFTKLDVWDRIDFDDLFSDEQQTVLEHNPVGRNHNEVGLI